MVWRWKMSLEGSVCGPSLSTHSVSTDLFVSFSLSINMFSQYFEGLSVSITPANTRYLTLYPQKRESASALPQSSYCKYLLHCCVAFVWKIEMLITNKTLTIQNVVSLHYGTWLMSALIIPSSWPVRLFVMVLKSHINHWDGSLWVDTEIRSSQSRFQLDGPPLFVCTGHSD